MSKIIIAIIIIIVIAGLGYWGYQLMTAPKEEAKEESPTPKEDGIMGDGILDMILADESSEVIDLEVVDGSNSSGKAYRLIRDGKLYHVVVANLPEPPEGNKYEGWLVVPDPLKFFSTGVMEKNEKDLWVLEYTNNQAFLEYYRVVITLETAVDLNPEKHIIEGDFSSDLPEVQEKEDLGMIEETILIKDFTFSPSKIIVKKGTKIIWWNNDSVVHTITAEGIFDSGNFSEGETFIYQFNQIGTINYICTIHPFMKGQIVVED